MSTFTATIMLGPVGAAPTHTYVVTNVDPAPSEADPVLVLDQLTASWSFPEDQLWPSQPDGQTFTLRLLVDDTAELADINAGSAAYLKVESAGTRVWEFSGIVGAASSSVVRRANARKSLFTFTIVDPLTQLADVLLTLDRPEERITDRWAAIVDAITAAQAADPTLAPAITVSYLGGLDPVYLPALSAQKSRAYDLLVDVLRQRAAVDSERGAMYVSAVQDGFPAAALGPWNVSPKLLTDKGVQAPNVPGQLALNAHKLGVTFPHDAVGLAIPSGEVVEDSVNFTNLRFDSVSRVTVTSGDDSPVTVANGLPGTEAIVAGSVLRHFLGGDESYALALAKAYLPRPFAVRWSADGFVWLPTDAELADLEFPLNPVNLSLAGGILGDKIVVAPVAITDLDPVVIPGTDSDFYAGTFASLTLRITAGVLSVEGKLASRIETRSSGGSKFVTWADIQANFPTVKTKVGADVLDPTMSNYELLLARKV